MALIKCPECGKEVSDKSAHCIHCGYPFSVKMDIVEETESTVPKYKVSLIGYQENEKVQTIKAVMNLTNLGLTEAKTLVENCPQCIAENVTNEEFEKIRSEFLNLGATVMRLSMSDISVSMMKQSKEPAKLRSCPTCGKSISSNANSCPNCGHSFVEQEQKNGLSFWGIVGAIIVAVLIMMYL